MRMVTGIKRLAVATAVFAVSLAGCKAGSSASEVTLPTTTSTTAATTTTTTPEQGYRQQWLNMASGANCRNVELNKAFDAVTGPDHKFGESDWPRLQQLVLPAFRALAEAEILEFQSAAQLQWPANVQAQVQQFVHDLTADVARLQKYAAATTYDDFAAVPDRDYAATNDAAAIRAALGLPTNLVDDGYDWCKGPPDAATLSQAIPTTTTPASVP